MSAKPKIRTSIGDAPSNRILTVNDIDYLIIGIPNTPEREIWRLDAKRPVGSIFKENGGCWVTDQADKCWRSQEQAAVEVAKADQGVDYAR
jgi:hypothetical protein